MKIVYWITTGLFSALMLFSAFMYLSHGKEVVEGMAKSGFPPFMLHILGTAKLLGAIALVVPKFPKLKEWAYAGFTFNLIGAIWTHAALGDNGGAAFIVLPFAFLITSYITFTKLQKNSETAITV